MRKTDKFVVRNIPKCYTMEDNGDLKQVKNADNYKKNRSKLY